MILQEQFDGVEAELAQDWVLRLQACHVYSYLLSKLINLEHLLLRVGVDELGIPICGQLAILTLRLLQV